MTTFLKHLFLLVFPYIIWIQVTNATLPPPLNDGQEPLAATCPYNQICTGDIVLIGMDNNLSSLNWSLISTRVSVAKDASDLNKGYLPVQAGGPGFHGFYYRVKPGKTYYFKTTYVLLAGAVGYLPSSISGLVDETAASGKFCASSTLDVDSALEVEIQCITHHFYFKSRGDALNPAGSGAEGPISRREARAMGLPPIPKCTSVKSPGRFCTNQVVHVFWSNDRGQDKRVQDIDLYIDGQHVKHDYGPSFGGHFQDFYYMLPKSKKLGEPIRFQVKWQLLGSDESTPSHSENSQTLENRYTPGWAFACRPTDSWKKCQYHWQED